MNWARKTLRDWEHRYQTCTALNNLDRLTLDLYLALRVQGERPKDEATINRRINGCRWEAEAILQSLARRRLEAETGTECAPGKPCKVDEKEAQSTPSPTDDVGGSDILLQGHESGGEEGEHPAPASEVADAGAGPVAAPVVKRRKPGIRARRAARVVQGDGDGGA